jgi:Na+/serine symporter
MSVLTAIVIAVAAMYMVGALQQTVDQAFTSSTNVRFTHEENSHNLVGKDWSSAKEY